MTIMISKVTKKSLVHKLDCFCRGRIGFRSTDEGKLNSAPSTFQFQLLLSPPSSLVSNNWFPLAELSMESSLFLYFGTMYLIEITQLFGYKTIYNFKNWQVPKAFVKNRCLDPKRNGHKPKECFSPTMTSISGSQRWFLFCAYYRWHCLTYPYKLNLAFIHEWEPYHLELFRKALAIQSGRKWKCKSHQLQIRYCLSFVLQGGAACLSWPPG